MNTRTLLIVTAAAMCAFGANAATSSANFHRVALAQSASVNSPATGERWDYETKEGGFLWASTRGDLGALGQYCNASAGACAWVLVLKGVACAEGEQHPVLVNTDQSASHNIIQCMGTIGGMGSAFAFLDFDRMDYAIRHGKLMGVAIPEQDDEIGVARFQLAGAADVIDRMRDALKDRVASGGAAAGNEAVGNDAASNDTAGDEPAGKDASGTRGNEQ